MKVTTTHIETCLKKAAMLVEAYGEEYWPTFERLERELSLRKGRFDRIKPYVADVKKVTDIV